jgi:hypothetical protein
LSSSSSSTLAPMADNQEAHRGSIRPSKNLTCQTMASSLLTSLLWWPWVAIGDGSDGGNVPPPPSNLATASHGTNGKSLLRPQSSQRLHPSIPCHDVAPPPQKVVAVAVEIANKGRQG